MTLNELAEKHKELQKDHDDLWQWCSDIASIVQCLVEDRLDDEDLSQDEKDTLKELLKKI